MPRALVLLFFLISFLQAGRSAELRFSNSCREAYEKIYALRFQESETRIAALLKSEPDNLMPLYLNAHLSFIKYLVSGEESEQKQFISRTNALWGRMDEVRSRYTWYHHVQASLHLQEAVFLYDGGQAANAGVKLKRAWQSYEEALKLEHDFLPSKLEKSVLEILFSSLPDEYAWVVRVLGIRPQQALAFRDLKSITDSLQNSARYRYLTVPAFTLQGYLLRNYARSKPQVAALVVNIDKHIARHPRYNSPLLIYTKAKAYSTLADNAAVIRQVESYIPPSGEDHFPYIYLMRAECRLSSLDAQIAKDCILFRTHFRGKDFIKRAYQLQAWEALLSGDTLGARNNFQQVVTQGRAKYEDDIQALREAASGVLPNVHLLRARLLYDGAYYERALSSLLSESPSKVCRTIEEQMEYFYRLARIHQAMESYQKALQFYGMVIDMGRESKRYFAGNAALQMGLIYEQLGQKTKAQESFNLCLRLPFEEYRKSIQQRARAGLSRLRA
jgi:tetratricopeptide (TPR) repeat protein